MATPDQQPATAPECIFCRIIANEIPASIVDRDEHTIAFMDIAPVTAGHLLVVPTVHAASLADLEPAYGERMFAAGQALAAALRRSGLRCEGVNLMLADGKAAGQEVFHVHLHVVPRFSDDGARFSWPRQQAKRETLNQQAAAVRNALGAR